MEGAVLYENGERGSKTNVHFCGKWQRGFVRHMLQHSKNSLKILVCICICLLLGIMTACSSHLLTLKPTFDRSKRFTAYNPLSCVAFSNVQPTHTIVDIMSGVGDCVNQERYHTAAELMMIAGSFAFFDTQRTSDEEASEAIKAVFQSEFNTMPRSKRKWLFAGLDALDANEQRRANICRYLHQLPPPSYTPYYIAEFQRQTEDNKGHINHIVKTHFNAQENWGKSLGYVLCLLNSDAGLSTQYLQLLQREDGSDKKLW